MCGLYVTLFFVEKALEALAANSKKQNKRDGQVKFLCLVAFQLTCILPLLALLSPGVPRWGAALTGVIASVHFRHLGAPGIRVPVPFVALAGRTLSASCASPIALDFGNERAHTPPGAWVRPHSRF